MQEHSGKGLAYGLTPEEVALLLSRSRCDSCMRAWGDSRATQPVIDHNHTTGKVRGVICCGRNLGLGHFRDDSDRLEAAARYLRQLQEEEDEGRPQ